MLARTVRLRRVVTVLAACASSFLAWTACVGEDSTPSSSAPAGAQDQPCFANGTCLVGLVCRDATCRVPKGAADGSPDVSDARSDAVVEGCTGAYRDAILADGPYAYWRMNPATGVTIVDETANHNDLTLAGSGFTLGARGALGCDPDPAIRFDGNQAYASGSDAFSRSVDFGSKEPFTIEVWVRREEKDGGPTYYHVFDNKIGSADKSGYLFYYSKALGVMSLEYDWPGGSVLLKSPPNRADVWTYYAVSFDGTTVNLYADGALVDHRSPVQAMGARNLPFVLARENDVDGHNFAGAIDEVAIYTRALSAEQVAHHHQVANEH